MYGIALAKRYGIGKRRRDNKSTVYKIWKKRYNC